MLPLEVVFDVPPEIVQGLATGALERVGGVIRETGSKQVVMWLREGAQIANNSNLAGGVLKSLLNVGSGGLTGVAFGALDAVVAANRHNQIMQQFSTLTNLVTIVGGIGVLNIATTVVSTAIVLKRINDLEQAIKALDVAIAKQFAQERQIKMEGAIHAADNAFDMKGEGNREFMARTAVLELFKARQHIWREIDTLKASSPDSENNELMQKNLEQAMLLDSLYSRCLLALENSALAKTYLENKLIDYRETSRNLVHRHLGTHRAAYFHHSVMESDLLRYISVEYWLLTEDNRLWEILLANRRDFWNKDVADEKNIKKPGMNSFIDALTQSELLIENQRRFEGILAEIEAIERLGIKHSELEQQQEEALAKAEINLAEHDDYVLLVDKEWLAEQSDSTAA